MTPERIQINNIWIPQFAKLIAAGSLVYDIGVGDHDYRKFFDGCEFKTIDRDAGKRPDIVGDVEGSSFPRADGIICIGVTEQCDNPFNLISGIHHLLADKGIVFFSILLTGYPLYDIDYFRFTHKGALRELNKYFRPIAHDVCIDKVPTCLFYIGEKL